MEHDRIIDEELMMSMGQNFAIEIPPLKECLECVSIIRRSRESSFMKRVILDIGHV